MISLMCLRDFLAFSKVQNFSYQFVLLDSMGWHYILLRGNPHFFLLKRKESEEIKTQHPSKTPSMLFGHEGGFRLHRKQRIEAHP